MTTDGEKCNNTFHIVIKDAWVDVEIFNENC